MGRLKEMLPIINIFDWANGEKYTIEEDAVLTPELAKSDKETDEAFSKHFESAHKENGKGKYKVDASQLKKDSNSKTREAEKAKESDDKSRDDD